MMSQSCFSGVQKHRYCVSYAFDTFQEKSMMRIKYQLRKTLDVAPVNKRVGCDIKSEARQRSLTRSLTWLAPGQVGGRGEAAAATAIQQGFSKSCNSLSTTEKQSSRLRHASSLFHRLSIFIVRQPLLVCALTSTSRPPPTSAELPAFPRGRAARSRLAGSRGRRQLALRLRWLRGRRWWGVGQCSEPEWLLSLRAHSHTERALTTTRRGRGAG